MIGVFPLPSVTFPPSAGTRFGATRGGDRPAECGGGHCGVDLYAATGTPIFAAAGGTVYTVGGGSSGNYIWLDHEGGWRSHYVHQDQNMVKKGQSVSAGMQIGTVGRTGIVNDPAHLHFALSRNGKYLDPLPYLQSWVGSAGQLLPLALAAGLAWYLLRAV